MRAYRWSGALNSQPLKTGGRPGTGARPGKASMRTSIAILIWWREKA